MECEDDTAVLVSELIDTSCSGCNSQCGLFLANYPLCLGRTGVMKTMAPMTGDKEGGMIPIERNWDNSHVCNR